MIELDRTRLMSVVLLLSTCLCVPQAAFAQTGFGDVLGAPDDSLVPDDVTIKGLSIRSIGRQIGLVKNPFKGTASDSVEKPSVRRGEDSNGDVSPNVLVNEPSLDNIQTFPGVGRLPFEDATESETSVAAFGRHVLVGYNSSANSPVALIDGNLAYIHIFGLGYSISHDGGRTFTSGFVPPTANSIFALSDPSVGVDRAGRFFYTGIGANADGHLLVQINRSDDHGDTFGTGIAVAVDDGADKEWLAVGRHPGPACGSIDCS